MSWGERGEGPRTAEEGESEVEVPQRERERNGGVGPNLNPNSANKTVKLDGLPFCFLVRLEPKFGTYELIVR